MIVKGLFWSAVLLTLMVGVSLYAWEVLPDGKQFPIHWNLDGEVNGTADKLLAVSIIPLLAVFSAIVFAAAPMFSPRRSNLEQSRFFYLVGWIGSVVMLTIGHGTIILAALTDQPPSLRWIFAANGVFLIFVGNAIAKSRSNWLAGIRTPWTLSSEHAWSISNRLAGWGFVAAGCASLVFVLTDDLEKGFIVQLGGVGASVLVSAIVSYLAWRTDPDQT